MLLLLSPAYQGPYVPPDKRAPAGDGQTLRAAYGQRPQQSASQRIVFDTGARPTAQNTTRPSATGGRRPLH